MSSAEFLMRFTKLTDWVYIDDELKTIFSHAGVSKVWLEKILKESDVHNINDYGLREEFGLGLVHYVVVILKGMIRL